MIFLIFDTHRFNPNIFKTQDLTEIFFQPIVIAMTDSDSNTPIIIWLYSCCAMIFAMVIIGAITRLTESGLSMVEWRPLIGALPPLNDAEWQRVFALYQETPEFQKKNFWMELSDFKSIFFWEWLHRLWGRLIGLFYALPLLFFWVKNMIPANYKTRLIVFFFLGGMQGLLGWWMVKSGLINQPDVSHFRLAAHLGLAMIIYSCLLWTIFDLSEQSKKETSFCLFRHGLISLLFLSITIIWGAFVAGLDAGKIYNDFPLMNGSFFPPVSYNPTHHLTEHGWVQFTHRWLAILTGLFILSWAYRLKSIALTLAVTFQVTLGIATLTSMIWLPLAALHQAGALILLSVLLKKIHETRHYKRDVKPSRSKTS